MEDALASIPNSKMKKSFTLPAGFRGLAKSQSFGKRIRQSFRVLVPSKKTVELVTEEKIVESDVEEKEEEEKKEDTPQTPDETSESECAGLGAESSLVTTKNNTTLPLSFKVYDLPAKTRQIFNKLVSRTKNPKKEALDVINSILDDILREVEGEEQELEENKEEIFEKEEEKTESEENVTVEEKQEDF